MFQDNNITDLSVDFCTSVLDAVHQEGMYPTLYSTVYDLKNGLIHLYYNHNYNRVKIFNLSEEIKLGYHSYSIPELFEQDKQPPDKPIKPIGKSTGEYGIIYYYKTSTIDPDDDDVYYLFDWGDETNSGWQGPFNSGETCNISHVWKEGGSYEIKVKARDTDDLESDWSDPLMISMPKCKSNKLILLLEELFPFMFKFINIFV
jgi:hypothetical protein